MLLVQAGDSLTDVLGTVLNLNSGLWTLDWTVDWTLDSIMDLIFGLEFRSLGVRGHTKLLSRHYLMLGAHHLYAAEIMRLWSHTQTPLWV